MVVWKTMSESERRDGTRLEQDDPQHCKMCGGRINVVSAHDSQGRPMSWDYSSGEWIVLEKCADCWADEKLDELWSECMTRYDGTCAKELWDR